MAKFPPQPTVANIKKQLEQAHESYHNDYDALAELVQNGIDAIRTRFDDESGEFHGRLNIKIDSDSREIIVEDNGVGMTFDQLDKSVLIYESGKSNAIDSRTIGEKGVGLSFAIFSSNYAEITSNDGNELSKTKGSGARRWLSSDDESEFVMDTQRVEGDKGQQRGTRVILSNLEESDFFELNSAQMEFVIRTRTAVGNTLSLWDINDVDVDVYFTYKNTKQGINITDKKLKFSYYLFDGIRKQDIISIDDFYTKFDANSSDVAKKKYLMGKYLTQKGTRKIGGREARWIALYVPNNDAWTTRGKELKLLKNSDEDESVIVEPEYAVFDEGITLSVKGMPTGISVDTSDLRGSSGYVKRMFLLIEDDGLKFDVGRKTVVGRTTQSYKKIAAEAFTSYRVIAEKWIAEKNKKPRVEAESRSKKFNALRKLPLLSGDTSFSRLPEQEGSVSGIFFDQLGRGKFGSLKIFQHGYSDIYDLYADYDDEDVVLEFKKRLNDFLKDAGSDVKRWDEVDYLVMYDLTDEDRKAAENGSVDLYEYEDSPDESHLRATAQIDTSYGKTIYIIVLSKIMKMGRL